MVFSVSPLLRRLSKRVSVSASARNESLINTELTSFGVIIITKLLLS